MSDNLDESQIDEFEDCLKPLIHKVKKIKQREEIRSLTDEFLNKGGKIKVLLPTERADDKVNKGSYSIRTNRGEK